jgi:hypothetical protein
MGIFSKIASLWGIGVAALKCDSVTSVLSAALKYGPLVIAIIEAIEKAQTANERQIAATEFERGFRVLTQTKDPRPLQAAIMAHCNRDTGVMLP